MKWIPAPDVKARIDLLLTHICLPHILGKRRRYERDRNRQRNKRCLHVVNDSITLTQARAPHPLFFSPPQTVVRRRMGSVRRFGLRRSYTESRQRRH